VQTLITGTPGAGKTVEIVERIFLEKKKVITNVPILEEYQNENIEVIEDLYSYIKENLKYLYPLQKSRGELIEGAKTLEFFNIAIYWDECHMDLDKQDKEIVWLFTYHRHLNLDIILVTQQKGLIATAYRKIPEQFINAVSPSLRFNKNNFKYEVFTTFAMSKNTRISTYTKKSNPETFKKYKTGEKNQGDNTLRKKAYKILGGILLAPLFIYFIVQHFKAEERPPRENNTTKSQPPTTITTTNSLQFARPEQGVTLISKKEEAPPPTTTERAIRQYKKEIDKTFPVQVFICSKAKAIIFQGYYIKTEDTQILKKLSKIKNTKVNGFKFGDCVKFRFKKEAYSILLPELLN